MEHDGEIWAARGGCACAQADSRKGSSREQPSHPARLNILAAFIYGVIFTKGRKYGLFDLPLYFEPGELDKEDEQPL